ncbi:MAG: glycosyltransferase [Hymenobacter sp.]|nr:MAG: glycosyltransferase [Hymenobacter sp.]
MFFVSRWRSARSAATLLAKLAYAKRLQGMRVVWLAHNVVPHERQGWRFLPARASFMKLLDGVVFLSASSRETVLDAYPGLKKLPQLVIPHGVYLDRGTSATPPPAVQNRPVRLVYAGRVKRYKAPDLLARCAATLPGEALELTIAGACDEPALEYELTALADSCGHIATRLTFLSDIELEDLLDGADAIVMPYRDILNSGSAIHALSRFRPFIAPRLGSLVELQHQVGVDWVWLYDGDLTPETLAAALEWVKNTKRSIPCLDEFQWKNIAMKLADFLRHL